MYYVSFVTLKYAFCGFYSLSNRKNKDLQNLQGIRTGKTYDYIKVT